MTIHIHIDPIGGIAGDMFLGALLDLGVDMAALEQHLARAGMDGRFHLSKQHVLRQSIGATDLKVHTDKRVRQENQPVAVPTEQGQGAKTGSHSAPAFTLHSPVHAPALLNPAGHAHAHEHVRRDDILAIVGRLDLPQRARDRAGRIVNLLAEAEASVHRMSPDQVHFHEVGAVDSIVDMLGAAVGLEMLGVETLTCGPLPIGRGFVNCAHGRMPLPAPATAYLLRGMATVGVDRSVETVTPTGAAIVAALAQPVAAVPPMKLQAVGYGAGDRDDPEVPNLVRLFLGER